MSLATRCAACGTVFRVVQDQLKVSEGWVRCGRCGDVFNALEGLFDLERETAPAWTPSQRGGLDLQPSSADEHAAQAAAAGVAAAEGESVLHGAPAQVHGAPAQVDSAEDTAFDTRIDSQVDTHQADYEVLGEDEVGRGEISDFDEPDGNGQSGVDDGPDPAQPAFLRQAESAAYWQRPRVRMGLGGALALLSVLLIGQTVVAQRDLIAVRWPSTTPVLASLCAPLGCKVEPLRRLDGLAVESSGLTQLDGPSLYRLQVALRNRDGRPLLMPSLDVTLTDGRGEVISRRVFNRQDFGVTVPATLAAGAELPLQIVLDAGDRRIAGYSIEIFYP